MNFTQAGTCVASSWDSISPFSLIPDTCTDVLLLGYQFSSVQSLSCVRLFVTPWTAAGQASLSIANSWSLLKLTSIESVMPSNCLILCRPLLLLPSVFPSIGVFSNESVLESGGQSIGVSALASVHPVNIQDWFPLRWTCGSPCSPRDQESSPTPHFKSIHLCLTSFSNWDFSYLS